MIRMRAAIMVAVFAGAGAGLACGGSRSGAGGLGAARGPGGAGRLGGAGGGGGARGRDAGSARVAASDAALEAPPGGQPDLATDFGITAPEGPVRCPTAAGALAAPAPALTLEDYGGDGRLDGRVRANGRFTVKERFGATAAASFTPAPGIETTCGASGPGAAHVRGRAADTGATYTLVLSTPVGAGKPHDHYDATATTGLSFRVALGNASAAKLLTLQVNLAGSPWDYTKDVIVAGTTWQTVTIPWGELQAAPGAPAFTPAALNQLVFPLQPDSDVDVYLDDLAFTP